MIQGLRKIVLESNGVVFGGAIRDEIIRDYYAKKFYENGGTSKEYNDASVLPEYDHRLLVPRDLDIYFKNDESLADFSSRLHRNGFKMFNNPNTRPLYDLHGVRKHTLTVTRVIGKTFTFTGVVLSVKVDVIVNHGLHLEPPFNKLDFSCNSLVEDKSGIRLSHNTGTSIDGMNAVQKSIAFAKIVDEIISLQAVGIFNWLEMDEPTNSFIRTATYRITKFFKKGFTVFSDSVSRDECTEDDEKTCIICQDDIIGPCYKLNAICLHDSCFTEYMKTLDKLQDAYNQPILFSHSEALGSSM